MTAENFDIEYKVRAREAAEKRRGILDLNAQDVKDRGITSSSFGMASSSVGSHRSEKWINGQQVQGQPVNQGRSLKASGPVTYDPSMRPATEPPKDNAPTHHKPSVFSAGRRVANDQGWVYSHIRHPREPAYEPQITRASSRRKKS